jgi:hypothetical protein
LAFERAEKHHGTRPLGSRIRCSGSVSVVQVGFQAQLWRDEIFPLFDEFFFFFFFYIYYLPFSRHIFSTGTRARNANGFGFENPARRTANHAIVEKLRETVRVASRRT